MKNKRIYRLLVFFAVAVCMVTSVAFAQDTVSVASADVGVEAAVLDAIAEESDAEDLSAAGVTPDSPFYGLDVAMDNIGLMFTFNKAKKAEKKLIIADERLREAKMMAIHNKLTAMEKAKKQHDGMLLSVEEDIDAMDAGNEEENLKNNLNLRARLEMHKEEISDVEQELTLRIRDGLTDEQKGKLDSFLGSMKGSSNSVDVKIQNKEEKIKAVMKKMRNMSDADVENKMNAFDREIVEEHFLNKTGNMIENAEKTIDCAESLIDKKEESGKNVTYAREQLDVAKDLLAEANSAFDANEIKNAMGLVFKAKRVAVYAASGFSIEKLMNTPVSENQEFMQMKQRIVERKQEMVMNPEKIHAEEQDMLMEQERLREMEENRLEEHENSDGPVDEDAGDDGMAGDVQSGTMAVNSSSGADTFLGSVSGQGV